MIDNKSETDITPSVWMRLTETCRPEVDEYVLVVFNKTGLVNTANWNGFYFERYDWDTLCTADQISHWLRIPALPKESD